MHNAEVTAGERTFSDYPPQ